MSKLADAFKQSALNNFGLLRKDIENCPDDIWEKKFGGDYYWDQMYHAIGSVGVFLNLLGVKGAPAIPEGASGNLRREADPSKPHGKKIALLLLEDTVKFLTEYFETLDDSVLLTPADFFGHKTTYGGIIAFCGVHLAYHVGACDMILRENGIQGAL
jgi:hypothetical protein